MEALEIEHRHHEPVAGRVAVVHRRVMPALYVLVRRGRKLDDLSGLTLNAQTALALLRTRREVSAGDVRQRLGLPADPRNSSGRISRR